MLKSWHQQEAQPFEFLSIGMKKDITCLMGENDPKLGN
jgi:hypothetical protein